MTKLSTHAAIELIKHIFNIYGKIQSNSFTQANFLSLFKTDIDTLAGIIAKTELPDLGNDFNSFFIGTLLGRMRLLGISPQKPSLEKCYETTTKWLNERQGKLIALWQSRRQGLAWAKQQHSEKYNRVCNAPLTYRVQFITVDGRVDEKYDASVARYMPLQNKPEAIEDKTHRIANSPLLVRNGPRIGSKENGLTNFIEQVALHNCGLIIACGFPFITSKYIVFPDFQVCADPDIDFQNYFGAVCPDTQKAKTQKAISLLKAVDPRVDQYGNSLYQTGRYTVATQKQHVHTIANDSKELWKHEINTYLLHPKTERIKVPPVIVHNLLIPDSNPAKLNHAQLELIYKSVVKTYVEGRTILIHCASGVGRSGEIAFILARLLIKEIPNDSIAAVQWLRTFRPQLIANSEQLLDAEKLAKEMVTIHQHHIAGIKEKQNPWRYVYERLNLKDWIIAVPIAKVQSTSVFWQSAQPISSSAGTASAAATAITATPPAPPPSKSNVI